jgi:SAM-dependent methyltransferase
VTDPGPASDPWTNQPYLREVQYKTDVNLAARQSIYTYQRPRIDLARETLGLAALDGQEAVADVGCGNGLYLAELARREHEGPVLGVDMSPGMLLAARSRAPRAGLLVADAAALPVRDGALASPWPCTCCTTSPSRIAQCVSCAGSPSRAAG